MKSNNRLLLNGQWRVDYLGSEPYTSEKEPDFTGAEGYSSPFSFTIPLDAFVEGEKL